MPVLLIVGRNILILLAFCCGGTAAWSQQSVADSLRRVLVNAPADTNRIKLLVDYGWEICETETQLAEQQFKEARQLAQRLHFLPGEGAAWNGLGLVEDIRGNTAQAIEYYKKALELRKQTGIQRDIAGTLNNLAVAYESIGAYGEALALHQQNLQIAENMRDTIRMARVHLNMAGALESEGLYPEAQTQINEARLIFENRGDSAAMAMTYTMLGHIYFELDRYGEALSWYGRSLGIKSKINDPDILAGALSDYANACDEMKIRDSTVRAIQYYLKALDIRRQLDDRPGIATLYLNLGDAYKHLENYTLALNYLQKALDIRADLEDTPGLMEVFNSKGDVLRRQGKLQDALAYTKKYFAIAQALDEKKYIQRAYKDFSEVYAAMNNFKTAYEYREMYDEYRYDRLNEQINRSFARKEALFTDQKRQQEIEKQQQAIKLRDAKLAETQTRNRALIGGGVALLLLVALLFNRNRIRAKANRDLAAQNKVIENERRRADDLLTNILPAATAAELKANNRVKPVRYASVTVLFSDFKNFTSIAEQMKPEELVQELDDYFRLFDEISIRHRMEKIKTIGDAYMSAGGLPTPNNTHAVDAVQAAINMQHALQDLMRQKSAKGKPVFEMRIGIHTGPVVAGVVGSHKFAYDIWGDTVNTAARLEQGGEPGKINISETTYELVKQHFPCSYRGRLSAKNKGEIAMYFVEYDGPTHTGP
jgi:adenylate cyclase